MPLGDILRYAFLTLIFLILLVFGMKWWGKHKTQKEIVTELRALTSASSSFEQFNAEDTRKTLFRCLYQLHLAEKKVNLAPDATLNKVFKTPKEGGGLMSNSGSTRRPLRDYGEELTRDSLLHNYEKSNRLGVFGDSVGLEALKKGEAPQIKTGESAGRWLEVSFIIDPKVSPGIEKIVPNLVVGPPVKDRHKIRPTEFDIAQAKRLAAALSNANRLERKALDRIVKYYDELPVAADLSESDPKDPDSKGPDSKDPDQEDPPDAD